MLTRTTPTSGIRIAGANVTTITLPPLHAAQRTIYECDRRFIIARCGRRFGKTRLAALLAVTTALQGGRVWWVAPTYAIGEVGRRETWQLAQQLKGQKKAKTILLGKGEIVFKTADDPQKLRGEGLNLVIVDEAAFINPDAWYQALRPALSDRLGRALFISTPCGNNWYAQLWNEAVSNPLEWATFHYRTRDNPYMPASELDHIKAQPQLVQQQEYEAQFIAGGGVVFRDILSCVENDTYVQEAVENRQYAIGVDLAKMQDFTVFTVVDMETRRVVAWERHQRLPYATQATYLQTLCNRFNNAVAIVEKNNTGDPFLELCHARGIYTQAFTTTNATKQAIIDALVVAFEQRLITIPNERILIDELSAFSMEMLPSGLVRYGAPAAMHDDAVMSLALAWHGAYNASKPTIDFV